MRACALLPAVTGNLGKPGAGFLYLNGAESRRIDETWLAAPQLASERSGSDQPHGSRGLPRGPGPIAGAFLLEHQHCRLEPAAGTAPRGASPDDLLTVAVDLFPTEPRTSPTACSGGSFLEFDDLVASYFHLTLSAQVKAIEPMGEALPNMEIFRRLARAMGYPEPELYEGDAELIETLARSGVSENFGSLAAKGTVPLAAEPVVQFADPVPDPERAHRDRVRSRRGRRPSPPAAALADPAGRGRLRLLSPASPWLLNDSFANDPKIAKRIGPATVVLIPMMRPSGSRRGRRGGRSERDRGASAPRHHV